MALVAECTELTNPRFNTGESESEPQTSESWPMAGEAKGRDLLDPPMQRVTPGTGSCTLGLASSTYRCFYLADCAQPSDHSVPHAPFGPPAGGSLHDTGPLLLD